MNVFRTGVLLSALVALFGVAGYALGGQGGMMIALLVAVAGSPLRKLYLPCLCCVRTCALACVRVSCVCVCVC